MSVATLPLYSIRGECDGQLVEALRRAQPVEITLDDVLPAFDGHGRHAAPVVDWSASVDDPARLTAVRLAVGAALEDLPLQYRAVLVLRDVEGMATAEVAAALGLTLSNAKTRIHRARLFVRKRLTESMALDSSAGLPEK